MKYRILLVWALILSLVAGPVVAAGGGYATVAESGMGAMHHAHGASGDSAADHCPHQHADKQCSGPSCSTAHCFSMDFRVERVSNDNASEYRKAVASPQSVVISTRPLLPPERPPRT